MTRIMGKCPYCDEIHDLRVACPDYVKYTEQVEAQKEHWWRSQRAWYRAARYLMASRRFLELFIRHGLGGASDIITSEVNRAKYEAIIQIRRGSNVSRQADSEKVGE